MLHTLFYCFFASLASSTPTKYANSCGRDGDDGTWSSFALRVGSPEQIVRVLPSTAGQQTWVVSPQGCPPGRHGTSTSSSCNESRGGLFDATRSSSWKALGNYFLPLEVGVEDKPAASYGLDTMALGFDKSVGGLTLSSQVIASFTTDDYYMGVFGLGHQGTNITNFNNPLPSFLTTMRNESLIPSLSWAYTAGARYRESVSNSLRKLATTESINCINSTSQSGYTSEVRVL